MNKLSTISNGFLFVAIIFLIITVIATVLVKNNPESKKAQHAVWQFRAIDTMKYSRDPSREKINDPTYDEVINKQVGDIAATGATHVAIATPYDEEFLPMLRRWVKVARQHDLKIWFRGNWSGWEGWFEYPKITRAEHIEKTKAFILANPDLFEDGDVFSACPECENGGPGDPRMNNDAAGHKQFLIEEYTMTKQAFKDINKDVASNYHSMNGDVARLIMDKETTAALDGLVVVDHYVRTPDQLVEDVKDYAEQSGGKVVLGEFGAPIPDINGEMTEEEQALWLREALQKLSETDALVGLSYWTNVGGSTQLWNNDGTPRKAVEELTNIYSAKAVTITVKNDIGEKIRKDLSYMYFHNNYPVTIAAEGYLPQTVIIDGKNKTVVLQKEEESLLFKIRKFFNNLL